MLGDKSFHGELNNESLVTGKCMSGWTLRDFSGVEKCVKLIAPSGQLFAEARNICRRVGGEVIHI